MTTVESNDWVVCRSEVTESGFRYHKGSLLFLA